MFEKSTKFKLSIVANTYDIATLQTTTNEVRANTETMIDSIFDDKYASTSTNQNYMIDDPEILEMVDTKNTDPMSDIKEEQNTEETMLVQVQ